MHSSLEMSLLKSVFCCVKTILSQKYQSGIWLGRAVVIDIFVELAA